MKSRILMSMVLALMLFSCAGEVQREDLEFRNGLAYKKGKSQPYSGPVVSYYAKDLKKEEVNYKDGKLDGPFKMWYRNGQPQVEGFMKEGKRDGLWIEYYQNGQKHFEGSYDKNREVGHWRRWDPDGTLTAEFTYSAPCEPLSQTELDSLLARVKAMPLEPVKKNEVAVLETNFGKMVIEFFPQKAPKHCAAFKRLVKAGFYDCTTFHRVIRDFMIQGGDIGTRVAANVTRPDGPGYTLKAEFNDIPHDRGIVSMARAQDPNSAGSQFFICLTRERTQHLDGKYTVFGRLIEGDDVLERIGRFETKMSPLYGQPVLPVHPILIERAYMETR